MTGTGSDPARRGGTRGHELDTQLTFASVLTRATASEALRPWGLPAELYGQHDEIRGARLTGDLEVEALRELLRAGLEGGLLRGAEVGRRGYLRSVTGSTEWMPWRRNLILRRAEDGTWPLGDVALDDGVRYLIE